MSDIQIRRKQQQQHQQPPQQEHRAVGNLRSVDWVSEQPWVKQAYQLTKNRYVAVKQMPLIGLSLVLPEMCVVWWWTFLHNIPWPAVVLSTLEWSDGIVLRILTFTQQKVEWDKAFRVIAYFLRPFTSLYKVISTPPEVKKQQQQRQQQQQQQQQLPLTRSPVELISEDDDDDDNFTDDSNLSDASYYDPRRPPTTTTTTTTTITSSRSSSSSNRSKGPQRDTGVLNTAEEAWQTDKPPVRKVVALVRALFVVCLA
ncbi:hypothetical protein Pcinc_027963, partial [Petrolisthes cinctipes]